MSVEKIIKVGLTGGIGSGKSTICRMFAMLGVPVYDSDRRAKDLMVSDERVVGAIKSAFGEDVYVNGAINRSVLAAKVFGNKEALNSINSIVHPAVMADFFQFAARCAEKNMCYVILESAIIFENNLTEGLDCIITVSASEEVRIKRTMSRDGKSRSDVEARLRNQLSDAERESRADIVIHNDDKELVWKQVIELDKYFRGTCDEVKRGGNL